MDQNNAVVGIKFHFTTLSFPEFPLQVIVNFFCGERKNLNSRSLSHIWMQYSFSEVGFRIFSL